MARITQGILGGFSGKAGSVVGYQYRGKSYIRGLVNHPSTKKPSLAQLASRERFKIVQNWRANFTMLFATTFNNHKNDRSAQNAAHAFNTGIISGEYPNYTIDYTKIVISSGNLPGLINPTLTVDMEHKLHFKWTSEYKNGALHNDVITVLVCYEHATHYEASTTVAARSAKECTFELKEAKGFSFAHVYLTVLSDDRERASNSVYMGSVKLLDGSNV